MATASVTNTLVDATTIEVNPLNTNFSDLVTFLNSDVVHKDGSVAMTGDLSMGSNKVRNLAAPTSSNDAARKTDIESLDAGDVTTGTFADARIPSLAASKITSGTFAFARIPTGTSSSTVAVGNHGHSDKVDVSGDTMTGQLILPNGSAASPALKLDTTAGIYSDTNNALEVKAGSVYFVFSGNGDALYAKQETTNLGGAGDRWDTVYAVQGSINTSDLREKQDVEALGYGLAEVLNVDPIQYVWRQDLGRGDDLRLGFAAQEVLEVIPEAVSVPENPDHMLGMNTDMMVAVLWRAVQELAAEVEALKA